MKLFRTKVWRPVDLGLFKWANILFGMIVGAYLADFVKDYLWLFIIAVILLAIKPMAAYFSNDSDHIKPL